MNTISFRMLAELCPMHLALDQFGYISHVGATLQKLRPDRDLIGLRFLEIFEIHRPRGATSMQDLLKQEGRKLHLRFRDAPRTALKGMLVAQDCGGGAIVNLSFGISVANAVRDYALTSADFPATDLAVEILYLVEAQSAAMAESRKLNGRLQGAMMAAEEKAFTDTLTGLGNRRTVDTVLARLSGAGRGYALMHLDLDFFKAVNDTLGHAAGDHVLTQVAGILLDETRQGDTVARVGGDEFVIILDGASNRNDLADIATRIIKKLENPILFEGKACKISGSIGIATYSGAVPVTSALVMEEADIALYASKRAGRARHSFFDRRMAMSPPQGQSAPAAE